MIQTAGPNAQMAKSQSSRTPGNHAAKKRKAAVTMGPLVEGLAVVKMKPKQAAIISQKILERARQITNGTVLERGEERFLFERLEQVQSKARQSRPGKELIAAIKHIVISANQRLVYKIIHESRRDRRFFRDLVQEGNVGLLEALKRFDYKRGYRFSTYAGWWVRAYVQFSHTNTNNTIPLSQRGLYELSKIRKHGQMFVQKFHREPTIKELAESTELTEARVSRLLAYHDAVSDQTKNGEGSSMDQKLYDIVQETAEDMVERESLKRWVSANLNGIQNRLDRREKDILKRRFGINPYKREQTLKVVSRKYGISRERVRQLEGRAIEKLRGIAVEEDIMEPDRFIN